MLGGSEHFFFQGTQVHSVPNTTAYNSSSRDLTLCSGLSGHCMQAVHR